MVLRKMPVKKYERVSSKIIIKKCIMIPRTTVKYRIEIL